MAEWLSVQLLVTRLLVQAPPNLRRLPFFPKYSLYLSTQLHTKNEYVVLPPKEFIAHPSEGCKAISPGGTG